jgi:hypothetical protein
MQTVFKFLEQTPSFSAQETPLLRKKTDRHVSNKLIFIRFSRDRLRKIACTPKINLCHQLLDLILLIYQMKQ